MTYEKQTWKGGDTITAEKLNHIEDGIANSGGGSEPLIVNVTDTADGGLADKTFGEIRTAFESGRNVLFKNHTFYPAEEVYKTQFVISVSRSIYDDGCSGHIAVGSDLEVYNVTSSTLEAIENEFPLMEGGL